MTSSIWTSEGYQNDVDNLIILTPKLKSAKVYFDEFPDVCYKSPYKYYLEIQFTGRVSNLSFSMEIVLEDGSVIDKNSFKTMSECQVDFNPIFDEKESREPYQLDLGPFLFYCCSYKFEGKRFRLSLSLNVNGQVTRKLYSPPFLIKAKKPTPNNKLGGKRKSIDQQDEMESDERESVSGENDSMLSTGEVSRSRHENDSNSRKKGNFKGKTKNSTKRQKKSVSIKVEGDTFDNTVDNNNNNNNSSTTGGSHDKLMVNNTLMDLQTKNCNGSDEFYGNNSDNMLTLPHIALLQKEGNLNQLPNLDHPVDHKEVTFSTIENDSQYWENFFSMENPWELVENPISECVRQYQCLLLEDRLVVLERILNACSVTEKQFILESIKSST